MSKKNSGSGVGQAALATAAVAAIAGAVFLYGTDAGKKKRKQIKSWTIKARGEVLEKLEKAKDVNEAVYHDVVKKVIEKYQKIKNVDAAELAELGKELAAGWRHIKRELSPKKPAKRKAPAAKKVVAPKK